MYGTIGTVSTEGTIGTIGTVINKYNIILVNFHNFHKLRYNQNYFNKEIVPTVPFVRCTSIGKGWCSLSEVQSVHKVQFGGFRQ